MIVIALLIEIARFTALYSKKKKEIYSDRDILEKHAGNKKKMKSNTCDLAKRDKK